MSNTDKRVDAYIAKAQPFARPILTELRARVHAAAPELEETIKWNVPFFIHGERMVASMAAFKQHVKVGLWPNGMKGKPVMVDVKAVEDLPPATDFAQQLKSAIVGAESGAGSAKTAPATKKTAAPKKAPAKKKPAVKAKAATKKKKAPATKRKAR